MNILYGIQTTGNGHIGRSRDIVKELKKRGHRVSVIFSGEQQRNIPYTDLFQPYKIFKGLTYVTENGKINYIKTAPKLDGISFLKNVLYYNAKDIDLVISDFEPVSVQIAKKNKIPSVGISHQTAFLYDIPYPSLQLFVRTIIEFLLLQILRFQPTGIILDFLFYRQFCLNRKKRSSGEKKKIRSLFIYLTKIPVR